MTEAGGLTPNYLRFIQVLRRCGIPVNPAETLDGLEALQLVDLGRREQVRAALRATLVKSEAHGPLFDRAFDLFFVPPEQLQARAAARRQALDLRQVALEAAGGELAFQGQHLDLTPEQLETYTQMGEYQQERLRDFLAESSAGHKVDLSFQPLIESIVRGHLDRWRRQLDLKRSRRGDLTGDEELDTVIEGALDGMGGAGPDGAGAGAAVGRGDRANPLLYLDMQDIADSDLPRATRLIRRLSRRLATRLSRRYKESHKKRRPNIRRTIRSNIRHGGALFDLRYRERKVTRPRLLLIADVSGSMARYTAFTLEFILGLVTAVSGVEAFVFSERLERVTERLSGAARKPVDSADPLVGVASEVIAGSEVWGKGTDLGTALETLMAEHSRLISRDTVVIVVSDTKTLSADQAAALLARLRPKVREILWLNTLPREEWDRHRTVALFARHTNMHECYTLAHLEEVIRRGLGRHFRPA